MLDGTSSHLGTEDFSVDMVTVLQDFGGSIPVFGAAERHTFDLPRHPASALKARKSPAVEGRTVVFGAPLHFPGGGTFWFWSDGRRQACRFNPAHLGRAHSLASFRDFSQLLDMANACCDVVGGRPRFSEGERRQRWDESSRRFVSSYSGALVTRMDICQLLSAGDSVSAASVVDRVSLFAHGVNGNCHHRGESLFWHKASKLQRVRFYVKGPELLKSKSAPSEVVDWCNEHGVIRHEVMALRRLLVKRRLDLLSAWNGQAALSLLREFDYFSREVFMVPVFDELMERCKALGWSKRRAARAFLFAMSWRQGLDIWSVGSRNTVYAARKDLLAHGIDIFGVYDAQASEAVGRVVSVKPIRFPAEPGKEVA